MKIISTVYGAYLSIIIILLVLIGFWSSMSKYESILNEKIEQQISKLETITNKPKLAVQWLSNKTLNLYIFTTKPIYVKYLIIESNNTIRFVPVNKEIFNSSFIRVMDYYNGEKLRIGIILLDGTIIFYDPSRDPIFTNNVIYDYSYLSNTTLKALYKNSNTTSIYSYKISEFPINPIIGWAFNKSFVIRDGSGTLYYFIPYYLGNVSWSSSVSLVDANFTSYTATVYFYDNEYGKGVKYIEVVRSIDATYIDAYIVYTDNSKRYLGRVDFLSSKTFYVDWDGRKDSSIYSYKLFNITYHIVFGVSKITIYYEYDEYLSRYKITVIFDGSSNRYFELIAKYNRTYFYIIPNYPYGKTNFIINSGETRIVTSFYGYDSFTIKHYLDNTILDISVSVTRTIKIAYIGVVNVSKSYDVSINVPYVSYDVYQPSMSGSVVSQYYIRPSDQIVIFNYDNYLLPGSNTLRVSATIPEIYKLIIEQPNGLIPYMIYIAWLDPRLIVNITNGGDDLLIHYGLVRKDANITFKYSSALLYKSQYANVFYMKLYNAGDTVSLSNINPLDKIVIIIPLEGSFKGNLFYLWIDSWTVIKQ